MHGFLLNFRGTTVDARRRNTRLVCHKPLGSTYTDNVQIVDDTNKASPYTQTNFLSSLCKDPAWCITNVSLDMLHGLASLRELQNRRVLVDGLFDFLQTECLFTNQA